MTFTYTKDQAMAVLTPRERDVMQYVVRGTANKVIASELGVSQRTIEAHRARIFQKLKVRNAVELAGQVMMSLHEPQPH
ncbi:response regulator transcription factor [Pusillimonas minor]|uniref:Response regulator transcription factor n=1 Tax=Pusillimonas minor TaxID=2697024 RepID=A0A842HSU7_9BURK|nr:LuxR C-terminal-related transcriptional regulator [Pusillimonas minor]MBC2770722.1 response regulator transcription factor [Pusillimonas minor]